MSEWKIIIKTVAPVIGTALGGPMAGTATKFIAEKLLEKPDATESEMEQAILTASTEQLSKLKEIDAQFKINMKKLDIDIYDLQNKDRNSSQKLFEINIWPQMILSALFVIIYLVIVVLILKGNSNLSQNTPLSGVFTTIIGVLTAAIPQILNFWFGSSLGSKEKTRSLSLATAKSSNKG